jgi:hypothetical protein
MRMQARLVRRGRMRKSEAVRPTVGVSRPQPGPASEVRPEADARLIGASASGSDGWRAQNVRSGSGSPVPRQELEQRSDQRWQAGDGKSS